MDAERLDRLIVSIDGLLSEYIAKRVSPTGVTVGPKSDDLESLLEHGIYPPDEPATPTRMALKSIGEVLGLVGGMALMREVYDAYEAKYGPGKAGSLSARWDTAASLWYH